MFWRAKTARDQELHRHLEDLRDELEERRAAIEWKETELAAREAALRTGVIRGFAYASDDKIKTLCAALSPDEKDQEIARLTHMLAREHARVDELGAACDTLTARLKAGKIKRTNPETPPDHIEGWDGDKIEQSNINKAMGIAQ